MAGNKKKKINIPYFGTNYDTKERFCSYWYQINEVISLNPVRVLEVGIGNSFVTKYLRDKSVDVVTLDVVPRLRPNVAGSILAIPFASESVDVVLCCEILEHLPYKDFTKALRELFHVSKKHVILSLPDVTTVYRVYIELPRVKPIKKLIRHPFPRAVKHEFDGEHYWEIGKSGYPLKRIESEIKWIGFNIKKTYRIFEFYYHRIFLLEKN